MVKLTDSQMFLLRWLAKEDFSSYGECKGDDFTFLRQVGLVQLHKMDARGNDYRQASVTEAGHAYLRDHP